MTSFPGGDRVAQATVMPAFFDRNRDVSVAFESLHPDLVVDAAGPFQNYGDNLDRMVDTNLAFSADDVWPMLPPLADATTFVCGIGRFDPSAKKRGRFAMPAQALAPH